MVLEAWTDCQYVGYRTYERLFLALNDSLISIRAAQSGAANSFHGRHHLLLMKVFDYLPREHYDQGLARISALIEQSLGSAGAQMSAGCISRPPWYKRHATETIQVVPCDAPKMKVEFTVQEIMDSWDGVQSTEVLQKVGLYVTEYVRFRQSPDKLRLVGGGVSGAQTTDS